MIQELAGTVLLDLDRVDRGEITVEVGPCRIDRRLQVRAVVIGRAGFERSRVE